MRRIERWKIRPSLAVQMGVVTQEGNQGDVFLLLPTASQRTGPKER